MTEFPSGEPVSVDQWIAGLYDELRIRAHAYLRREQTGHTLNTTGLVHEAYLRLSSQADLAGAERTRFLAAASNTMRRVLVDSASPPSRCAGPSRRRAA